MTLSFVFGNSKLSAWRVGGLKWWMVTLQYVLKESASKFTRGWVLGVWAGAPQALPPRAAALGLGFLPYLTNCRELRKDNLVHPATVCVIHKTCNTASLMWNINIPVLNSFFHENNVLILFLFFSFLRDRKNMTWHSNAVVERISYNQVKTSSGNVYLLQGRMDSASMRKEGKKMILNVTLQTKEGCRSMTEHRAEADGLSSPASWAQWGFSDCRSHSSRPSHINGSWHW